MRTKFNGILTLLLVLFVQISFAQERTISGTVADESGPLPGVTVIKKGTTQGTETDFDGNYTIKVKSGEVLVFSFVGMKTVEKTVGSSNQINVTMETDNLLEEVVVTAYGTQKKQSLTGSIGEVKSQEFTKVASGNAVTGLAGKVAGVQIYANSGQPGAAPSVRFRGIGSLTGSSAPLYVVDGVPFNESITSINPNDIESMSFLKDAAAAALYGNRGANGVIILTTKKGKKGNIKVNLDVKTSFTDRAVADYDVMTSPGEYYEAYHRMLKNNEIAGGATEAQAGITASQQLIDGPAGLVYNTLGGDRTNVVDPVTGKVRGGANLWAGDWNEKLFSNASGVRSTFLSISGGSEKTNYYMSFGHEDNEGYNVNTGFRRYTFKTNVDAQVNDAIKIGTTLNYSNRLQKGTLTNNITGNFAWVRNTAPIYPVFAVDHNTGELALDINGNPQWDWADVVSPNAASGRPYSGFSNPHALQTLNINEAERDNFYTRAYAKITLLEGLDFTYNFGIDLTNANITNYTNKVVGSGVAPGGRLDVNFTRGMTTTNQQLINWRRTFADKHNVDLLLGHESSEYDFKNLRAQKRRQFLSTDTSVDLFAENDGAGNVSGGPIEYNLEGYFARLNYDFDNKYYFNASFRRDGSSVFHPDNRWGNFWGAGAAWRLSNENFMSDVTWINELKIKTSIGSQGNDIVFYPGTATRNYVPYEDQYTVTSDGTNFSPEKTVFGNKDLQWETSTNFNAGFELNMLNNRLRIESEYFVRKISDLIFNRPLPDSTGFPSVPENVMDMENRGVELSVAYDIITNDNLTWTVDLNATHYKNEITKLAPGREFIDNGIYRWTKGGSAFDFFIRDYVGINPANGHAIWATEKEFEADGTTPTNGTTEDSSVAEQILLGKSALPDVYGGFSTTLTYKNFDFAIDLNYQFGGYSYDAVYNDGFDGGIGRNFNRDFSKTWGYDNTTGTLPRVFDGTTSYFQSDLFLRKSDYISLNNLVIGYSIPQDITSTIGLSKVRIYAIGNNLALWTADGTQGFDPRASVTGNNNSVRYSTLKTYTLGVNINF
ncbi:MULTISPECIES: SusC/RagA family TonB-linked outer membrane protein [unclassified Tenacibaculum]|uniref:SusC/RagA family TonB-linked outer membrane protein n=1 Tax=unclassified Tenacibaculum TaxID=2635139 RepID=UPI001F1D71CC|nr:MULTISPECIES: TonB-dependent receptor [unclassified Tenacibaculum]MCF2873296.1 TonB-dependent receptor [Tenacibaculum sp. Cn5-1]MCF2933452.1 TonB-dependent receptor [Tenacibaculum sp. Cn5-34]MCG7509967.1 TonB-dependent receptor [Tenacibaculum sp. Cn5-46]